MAQQAQELDALRQSFATKNEIARQGCLRVKPTLIKDTQIIEAEQEYIDKSLQNEMLYSAKNEQYIDTIAEQTAIKTNRIRHDVRHRLICWPERLVHENNDIICCSKVIAIATR